LVNSDHARVYEILGTERAEKQGSEFRFPQRRGWVWHGLELRNGTRVTLILRTLSPDPLHHARFGGVVLTCIRIRPRSWVWDTPGSLVSSWALGWWPGTRGIVHPDVPLIYLPRIAQCNACSASRRPAIPYNASSIDNRQFEIPCPVPPSPGYRQAKPTFHKEEIHPPGCATSHALLSCYTTASQKTTSLHGSLARQCCNL